MNAAVTSDADARSRSSTVNGVVLEEDALPRVAPCLNYQLREWHFVKIAAQGTRRTVDKEISHTPEARRQSLCLLGGDVRPFERAQRPH